MNVCSNPDRKFRSKNRISNRDLPFHGEQQIVKDCPQRCRGAYHCRVRGHPLSNLISVEIKKPA